MAVLRTLVLQGTARQSSVNQKRTAGGFSRLVKENEDVFRRYFGIHLFPGSFNVDVANPPDLQRQMDDGLLPSDFVIPRTELGGMPEYIGDGQAWCCEISGPKVT
ncbi:MAG TPA: hypothetical protein VGC20_11025, partial [bacterium]